MDRHRGKAPPSIDRENFEESLNGLLKGPLKCDISSSAVDELLDLSGIWDFGNTQERMKQQQHRLDRDAHRKLIDNVQRALDQMKVQKDYLIEAFPFDRVRGTSEVEDSLLCELRQNENEEEPPFPDPQSDLAEAYETLEVIAKLPSPGELSSERPDFATPRDGLIVALGAWWRKHVGREPSANNKDAPFVRLCRYAMTDKQLSYATVNKALKNTPKLAEKFEKLRREAESWEHDPF